MTTAILVIGATGNTGRDVVSTLSKQLQTGSTPFGYKILAQTRSSSSPAARKLAELPGVEVVEQHWVGITSDWLQQRSVTRAFVASHNEPNQFAEESTFYLAALNAGVKYVVRVSTGAPNVRPDCAAYYPRTHWAIETLLSSPEFRRLQWTSLQPNIFTPFYVGSAARFVKEYRKTGKQGVLKLMASKDGIVGAVHPGDVGRLAATLLIVGDPSAHNQARYVVNGPQDITGSQLVEMVEREIGAQVEEVRYKDISYVYAAAEASPESRSLILSKQHALEAVWAGMSCSTTSPEVSSLCAPIITPSETFNSLLKD